MPVKLLIVAALFGSAAAFALGPKDKAIRLRSRRCQAILHGGPATIQTLLKNKVLVEVRPDVFSFRSVGNGGDAQHEFDSATKFLAVYPGQILMINNFYWLENLPAVDAVYYPADGGEPQNLSFKTSMSTPKVVRKINKLKTLALESIRLYYKKEHFVSLLRFEIVKGVLQPKFPPPNNSIARTHVLRALFKILGFSVVGREQRPVSIFLDLSISTTQRPIFFKDWSEDSTFDDFLKGYDDSLAPDQQDTFRVNLSRISHELSRTKEAGKLIVLFANGVLEVDKSSYFFRPFPISAFHELELGEALSH